MSEPDWQIYCGGIVLKISCTNMIKFLNNQITKVFIYIYVARNSGGIKKLTEDVS